VALRGGISQDIEKIEDRLIIGMSHREIIKLKTKGHWPMTCNMIGVVTSLTDTSFQIPRVVSKGAPLIVALNRAPISEAQ
jgi:hypothetical protein